MNKSTVGCDRTGTSLSDEQVRDYVNSQTWYQPVPLGNGIYTTAVSGVHDIFSPETGLTKWNYIIERNLPDVQGMRVLDIGCNAGLFTIQLARAGAREVVGIDSKRTWEPWHEQATFVKDLLERRCETTYNVTYIDASMTEIPDLDLGRFDLVIALCSIYYIEDGEIRRLLRHFHDSGTGHVLLQCNTHRRDQTPDVHRRAKPRYLAGVLSDAGYPHVRTDKPMFYGRPVVVGRTTPFENRHLPRKERLRDWLRRRI